MVCGRVLDRLSVTDRMRHVNACLDAPPITTTSTAASVELATAGATTDENAFCLYLQQGSRILSLARRTIHINRCMDKHIQEEAAKRPYVEPQLISAAAAAAAAGQGADVLMELTGATFSCVVCGRNMDRNQPRVRASHLKACAEQQCVSPRKIIERLRARRVGPAFPQPRLDSCPPAVQSVVTDGGSGASATENQPPPVAPLPAAEPVRLRWRKPRTVVASSAASAGGGGGGGGGGVDVPVTASQRALCEDVLLDLTLMQSKRQLQKEQEQSYVAGLTSKLLLPAKRQQLQPTNAPGDSDDLMSAARSLCRHD